MVSYIPILTTIFSVYFFIRIFAHYRRKPKAIYLLCWTIGVLTYGIGTLTESVNVLSGWGEFNFRMWYIFGALLGGVPLAQGSVYLIFKKNTANILTLIFGALVIIGAICVMMSPVTIPPNFDGRLGGSVLDWKWIAVFPAVINTYALIFFVGGAFYSAFKYRKLGKSNSRFLGNIYIAIGGLLPGIGGTFTKFGMVEMLFVTEFIGLLLIFFGYVLMLNDREISIHKAQTELK